MSEWEAQSKALSPDEFEAISRLKQLEKDWPPDLWLFAADGSLYVMKKVDGHRIYNAIGSVERDHEIARVSIEADGGDW